MASPRDLQRAELIGQVIGAIIGLVLKASIITGGVLLALKIFGLWPFVTR